MGYIWTEIDIYVDMARFLPDDCTATKIVGVYDATYLVNYLLPVMQSDPITCIIIFALQNFYYKPKSIESMCMQKDNAIVCVILLKVDLV